MICTPSTQSEAEDRFAPWWIRKAQYTSEVRRWSKDIAAPHGDLDGSDQCLPKFPRVAGVAKRLQWKNLSCFVWDTLRVAPRTASNIEGRLLLGGNYCYVTSLDLQAGEAGGTLIHGLAVVVCAKWEHVLILSIYFFNGLSNVLEWMWFNHSDSYIVFPS